MMNEMQVLDIIRAEFRAMRLPLPCGISVNERDLRGGITDVAQARICWHRISRRIVSECETEKRHAARLASQVGASITRGRTRL